MAFQRCLLSQLSHVSNEILQHDHAVGLSQRLVQLCSSVDILLQIALIGALYKKLNSFALFIDFIDFY